MKYQVRISDGLGDTTIDATNPASAVKQADAWVLDGEWGDERKETLWVDYFIRPVGRENWGCHTVEIHPDEPECVEGEEHDWQSPLEVVGGCKENPGVFGNGGGVKITEVCRHCGAYLVIDTWAQRPDTGQQGLRSVEYRPADAQSQAWLVVAV